MKSSDPANFGRPNEADVEGDSPKHANLHGPTLAILNATKNCITIFQGNLLIEPLKNERFQETQSAIAKP